MEKSFFLAPWTLVDPPFAPTVRGPGCPLAPPSDRWYGGVDVSLGNSKGWKPQKVGGCGWSRCPWNWHLFLARFEPVVTHFGPWKIPKYLENAPFWGQKWVKIGSKMRFSRSDLAAFGNLKQVFLALFEPVVVTHFGPWKIPKCLRNGPFGGPKWVQNGSKPRVSKSDLGALGMFKQVK